jgi:monoamine oxidase
VWTGRAAPIEPFHAELGGEFIDEQHKAIRKLCRQLGIPLVDVIKSGFGAALEIGTRTRVFAEHAPLWKAFVDTLKPAARAFERTDEDETSTVAAAIARRSLADLLSAADAEPRLLAYATALRGLYLAEPADLSALVAVQQTLAGNPASVRMSRVKGGNDRLIAALQKETAAQLDLQHVVRGVAHDTRGVSVTIEGAARRRAVARADYLVAAVPAPLLLEWTIEPALPEAQQLALRSLVYGAATKAVLRFRQRWWRRGGRPKAFSTNLPVGAVWESAEEQKKAALLTLLAGASASSALREILERDGGSGATKRLRWLNGGPREQPQLHWVSWERDPWARGGYAAFTTSFDPTLRPWLARGSGRLLFAGEHTSNDHQGSMNGAVESGLRAAREVLLLKQLASTS